MKECPFCGVDSVGLTLSCGTVFQPDNAWNSGIWKLGWNRTSKCYETQLAQQAEYIEVLESTLQATLSDEPNYNSELVLIKAELLRQALEVVRSCANTPLAYHEDEVFMSYFYECVFCEAETKDKNQIVHREDCDILKAQALISALEKSLEKVK